MYGITNCKCYWPKGHTTFVITFLGIFSVLKSFTCEWCLLQFWLETDKAAYLLRQYFFNNLHDRLSTRPFLSLVEKKWLAFQVSLFLPNCLMLLLPLQLPFHDFVVFQLLFAVKQSHENGICHGKIITNLNLS